MKNCPSKTLGVESKGVRGMVGSMSFWAAMECAIKNQVVSNSSKPPASLKRAKILSTVSVDIQNENDSGSTTSSLTERLRDEAIGSSLGSRGTTDECVEWGHTGAVGDGDGASELNAVRDISAGVLLQSEESPTNHQRSCCCASGRAA